MKLITRDTDYAVRALVFLAHRKGIIPVGELASELGISHSFLRKICQILSKHNILTSHKGKGGGFSLTVQPEEIYLTDLITMFRGPFTLEKCIFIQKMCPERNTCILRKELEGIESYVTSRLRSITIDYLINPDQKKG